MGAFLGLEEWEGGEAVVGSDEQTAQMGRGEEKRERVERFYWGSGV